MKQNDLCRLMENAAGRTMRTPQDFDYLAACIMQRTKQPVSISTLKRLYGYVQSSAEPRRSTLDILSQFVGYKDYASFEKSDAVSGIVESNPLMAKSIHASALAIGKEVTVAWDPDRQCTFLHLGNKQFQVKESRNSKLSVGDTFTCSLFVDGEPLYLENLCMNGSSGLTYVCGKQNGIRIIGE